MTKNTIKNITITSLLSALFVLLSFFSIKFPFINITLQNITIYIGAIYLGPIIATLVGGLGMFITQMLQYGITITTVFWIMPYMIIGYLAGLMAKKINCIKLICLKDKNCLVYLICLNLILTFLNTISIYIDSKVFGYYSIALIFGSLIVRIISSIVTAMVYYIIILFLHSTLCKIFGIE